MTDSLRRSAAFLVTCLLVATFGAVISASAAESPSPALSPQGEQTAAKDIDPVTFAGSIDPDATLQEARLRYYTASQQAIASSSPASPAIVTHRVSVADDGSLSGTWQLSRSNVPAGARFVAFEVDVTQPEGVPATGRSELLAVDGQPPYISGATLVAADQILVQFNEPVTYPRDNEGCAAWVIDGERDYFASVSGSGDTRTLGLSRTYDENAEPLVEFRPAEGSLCPVYRDAAHWNLDAAPGSRSATAVDGIAPDPPSIDRIAGEPVPAHGNEERPTIRVTGLTPGDSAEVFLASTDASQGVDTADDEGSVTITVPQPLGDDGTYSFYARAADPNGNESDDSPQAAYTLDTEAPIALNAVVDPDETGDETTVDVFLSEAVSGTDGAEQWSLTGCASGCPSIVAVTGADGSSERRLEADGAVPAGAQLAWDPPATGGYTDEAGNPMAAFDGLDIDIELPAFLQVLSAGTALESADVATFTVQLTEPESSIVVVSWTTRDGTAIAGEDYESDSGLLTFLPGQTEQQVEVALEDDSTDEPDETFSVEITQSSGAPVDEDGRAASAMITDDDPAPTVSLAGDAGIPEGDDENTFTLPVNLAAPSGKQVTVDWATSGGTATAGQDYRSASGTVTFEPGATSASLPLEIVGDVVGEPDETFRVLLANATNATIGTGTATVTIVNDDPTAFRARDASVAEPPSGSVLVDVQVTAVPPPTEIATVAWETVDGTATAGQDYDAASGTLTFEPGAATRAVQVRVHANGDGDTDETFRVRLSDPTGDASIADAEAVVTIGPSSAGAACPADRVPDLAFDDVAGIHADNIACASWYTIALGKGDIDGDGRPEYDPGGFVTRAQMASFIARLAVEAGVALPASPDDAFPDDDSSVHSTAIDQLASLGIVNGRADTGDADGDGDTSEVLYFPHARVTRAQMATFIAAVHAEAAGALAAGPDAFEDDAGSVHRENIDRIAAAGIVKGRRDAGDADGDGDRDEILYFPADPVTRGQMATFLMQDLGQLVQDGAAHVGGAGIELTTTSVAAGGDVTGQVATNKEIRSLTADGCGIDDRAVPVASDRSFSVTIPQDQPAGSCTLELTVRTRRSGSATDQAVPHTETITVG